MENFKNKPSKPFTNPPQDSRKLGLPSFLNQQKTPATPLENQPSSESHSLLNPLTKTADKLENLTDKLPTDKLENLTDKLPTDKLENLTNKLPLPGLGILFTLLRFIRNFFISILTFIGNIVSGVKTLFQIFIVIPIKIYLFIVKVVTTILSWIKALIKACINLIIKIYKWVIATIGKILLGVKILFQIFIAIPVKIYLFVVNTINKIFSAIKAVIKACFTLIVKILQLLKMLLLSPFSLLSKAANLLKKPGETVGNLGEGVGETVGNLGEGVGETVGNLGEGLGEVGEGVGETVGNLGEGLGETGETVTGLIEGVGKNVTGLLPGAGKTSSEGGGNKNRLGKSQEKPEEESPPPPSQPDSSESLSTDTEAQSQEEVSPSTLPLLPEPSDHSTDTEAQSPDKNRSELPDTSDAVYKSRKGLIYVQDLNSNGKNSNLYTLDLESGKTTLVGSMGMPIVDIAWCGDKLYGIRWRDSKTTDLVRIDPTTAKTKVVGKLGDGKVGSLAYSSHRKSLYAFSPQALLRVNVKTGAGRIIRSYKPYYPLFCGSLAFNSKGQAYSDFGHNENKQRYLMRIDMNTGKATTVADTSGCQNAGSLDFYGDELYAIFKGQIVRYDLVSGKASLVGYTEPKANWAGMSVKSQPRNANENVREAIAKVKAELGVSQLTVEVDAAEIEAQSQRGGKISFIQALKLAIQSFLEDGRNYDSPVGSVLVDPGAYNLQEVKDKNVSSQIVGAWMNDASSQMRYHPDLAPMAMEQVRVWMNDPTSKLILSTPESRYFPENGESIEANWIFRLDLQATPLIHWAIVDRSGEKQPYNYGYG